MSTMKIRRALEIAEAYANTGDSDEPRLLADVRAALAELEAIEKAADSMACCEPRGPYRHSEDVSGALGLFASIGREARQRQG